MYRFFTTPIYYANDVPHLGHFYTTVAADILARFFKLAGAKVKFTTGTDEHGAKIAQTAEARGRTPQSYVDEMSLNFRRMVDDAGVCPDDFIRTTEPRHHQAAVALWKNLVAQDQIYLGHYEGWYAVRDEAFYEEGELIETPEGRKSPFGAPVEWVQEPCYFFRLSSWKERLIDFYQEYPQAIAPESRYNEVMGFLKGEVRDLAISRKNVSWGIPVPGKEEQVMYVWIDALVNYLTVLGYPQKTGEFQHFWPQATHLIGKDILRFHAVYWPAFLMALGITPPKRIFAHGWWLSEGEKMSKSLGNVIQARQLVEEFGLDRVRYFLFRHVRFGQDGDCSKEVLVQRTNQELGDRLGNLAHRVLTFLISRLNKEIVSLNLDNLSEEDEEMFFWFSHRFKGLEALMDRQDIYGYLEVIYEGISKANHYMTCLEPWVLIKRAPDDPEADAKMRQGLSILVHVLRDLALLLWPVMPETSQKLLSFVGSRLVFEAADEDMKPSFDLLGTPLCFSSVASSSPLFEKILLER